jgi:hypothetical protein
VERGEGRVERGEWRVSLAFAVLKQQKVAISILYGDIVITKSASCQVCF